MSGPVERIRSFLEKDLWSREPIRPAPLGWVRNTAQLGIVIGEGFARDQLLMRAHALTYLTLLSIVPLLALGVSMLRLVGGSDEVLRHLLEQFAAATPQAREWLLQRVSTFKFGALGTVGGAALLATTVMAVGGVERSLNAIWGVKKARPWARRIPDYLAVLTIAPLVLGVAIPLRASLESQWVVQRLIHLPGLGILYRAGLSQAPTLLLVGAFTVLYWFLPNTKVRLRSALLGGVVAAVLFAVAQWAYLAFSVGAAKYNAVFGVLAGIALFMVWIYFSWAIVLFGAEVAYAHQTLPLYRREVRGAPASPAEREAIGLAIAALIARAFRVGAAPWSADSLSEALDVPLRTVREVIEALESAAFVRPCGGDAEDTFQLARPAETVRVSDVLAALRGSRRERLGMPEVGRVIGSLLDEVDLGAAKAAETRTLGDLAEALGPAVDRKTAGS